jgi:hypothetical protein
MTILFEHRDSAYPREVRGTADPSASLGMTKGELRFRKERLWDRGVFHHLGGPHALAGFLFVPTQTLKTHMNEVSGGTAEALIFVRRWVRTLRFSYLLLLGDEPS